VRLGVEAAIVEGELLRGDIEVADGKIVSVGLAPKRGGGIAAPGFVDLQVNGYAGVDFAAADAAGYATAGEALLEGGVTAYQPTLITAPEDSLLAALRELPPGEQAAGPRILGVHLEGPFLSPARLGAHPAASRRDPDRELLERLLAAGPVSHMTLAPELPGALELVDLLLARGIVVSCGHTDATAAEAHAAFDRGVGTVTHLFNAMRPLGHRDPGIAGAALVRDDVIVQVILDGHHLARETAQLVWRTAAGRVALVTDAIAAAGTDATTTRLSGIDVEVRDGVARRADGVLAGSVVTMIDSVRNLHALGASLVDAIAAATSAPARAARRPGLGVLEPGGEADIVVLDDRLEIRTVLRAGLERVAA
jgi:N-acetylglucosamine-6-phosphate deacetylase